MTPPDAILALDETDPLRSFRARFTLPEDVIYLDGNSLGALPVETPARVADVIAREWGRDLITSWNVNDWIGAPQRVGAKIARLIGARENEVVVADSTSANIFKLLVAGVRYQPGRTVILTETGNFPTDLYIAQGVADLLPDCALRTCDPDMLVESIDSDTAIVLLTHVHYKSGRKRDMAAITAAAHAKGALILWDLSHSAGAVPVDLNECGADLAVGCGYKYLNGGPGAPAFLYVAEALHPALKSPLTGWMGHAEPFAFGDDYRPAKGIDRFLCGTPPILGMVALEIGIDLHLEADPTDIATKAESLSELFIAEVERHCTGHGLTLVTPRRFADRGSHVSFAHGDAFAVCQALIANRVIGDFRAPNLVRFGFTPLYTSHTEVWRAAAILGDVLATRAWDDPKFRTRSRVT